jgi:hypothetical protein
MKFERTRLFIGTAFASAILLFGASAANASFVNTTSYPQNTTLNLSGTGINLTILAGSVDGSLTVTATNFTVAVSPGGSFTVRYPGPNPGTLANNGGLLACNLVGGNNELTVTGSANVTVTPSATVCGAASHSSGGGSGGVISPPSIAVNTPAGGASYAPGAVLGIGWTPADGSFVKYKVSYTADNGATWLLIDDNATSTALSWTVPNIATAQGQIKVEGYDSSGNLLVTALSAGNFTITGTGTTPPPPLGTTTPPPATDSTATGAYDPALATSNTPDIDTDKGLVAPPVGTTVYCAAGTLIKGSLSVVYYCGKDGKRYVFVNDKAFFTWYDDFSSVVIISDTDLAKIPLGGNITYRPGKRMIKVQSDPRVYVISRGGLLRWVSSEAIALQLYGPNWATMIDDVSDAFFVNYTMGPQL